MNQKETKVKKKLKSWFLKSSRNLPWRENPTPYEVWVSEVMLQQTQVSVVVPYFLRWMELFPSILDLAKADLDEVIKAWEGLGYYSRARNLHEGAKYVVAYFGGDLPSTKESLSKIKGLGPYTIGAILSFAFRQKAAAVDGNVIRVITRFLGIEDDISRPKTIKTIRDLVVNFLPDDEPWITSEALIELGATVCQKRPKCGFCPLKDECRAFAEKKTEQIPFKSAKTHYEKLNRTVAVVVSDGHVLLRRGQEGEIMNDLYQFPYFEGALNQQELEAQFKSRYQLSLKVHRELKGGSHSFTKYRVKLFPYFCFSEGRSDIQGLTWISCNEVEKLAFSSGHRRILRELASSNFKYL